MDTTFRYVLSVLMLTVAVMQFIQVIARYILNLPLPGLEELLVYPTLWLYLMGSANASRQNTQITANVLDIFLKTKRSKVILLLIGQALSLIIVCWLFYWALDYERYARRIWKETSYLFYPLYLAEVAMPVGIGLMTLFTATNLYKTVKTLVNRSYEEAPDPALDDKLTQEDLNG